MTNQEKYPNAPSTPAPVPVPVALTPRGGPSWSTSPIERLLVARLGGTPWTGPDPSGDTLAAAVDRWSALRGLLELDDTVGGWMSDDTAKFRKTRKVSPNIRAVVGTIYHSAHGARAEWEGLSDADRRLFAAVLECTVGDIDELVRPTFCDRSTSLCRKGCVVTHSANARLGVNPLTWLSRSLLLLTHPAEAFEMTNAALATAVTRHGVAAVRWRANINDDVRWELVAPGLYATCPGYSYTKHPVADRPELPGVSRIVYSVTENWTDRRVIDTCAAGHTVAVVFNIRGNQPLPTQWHGIPVVDGDASDDLWSHPHGAIVGLSVKGRTTAIKDLLAHGGFARL